MIGKAEIDIDLGGSADIVYRSIICEANNKPSNRSKTDLFLRDRILHIDVTADDITMLRAALNTWLRLIKISFDLDTIVKELF
ncbi:MAG: KEOPS complex subunit Pcc1 [Halobacteriota archaeon]|nr:KEOPS complex subunit Pcc1 [Halobacteriota archaeon]